MIINNNVGAVSLIINSYEFPLPHKHKIYLIPDYMYLFKFDMSTIPKANDIIFVVPYKYLIIDAYQ